MTNSNYFANPEYIEYLRLLLNLHDLIAADKDESEAGELLREKMDRCSQNFADDEIRTLAGIAGDFYSLHEHEGIDRAQPTDQVQQKRMRAVQLMRAGDFNESLAILRDVRKVTHADELAYLRGRIFSEAGLIDIGWRFFQRASQLNSQNANYRFIELDTLLRFNPVAAKAEADSIVNGGAVQPPIVRLKAAQIKLNLIPGEEPSSGDNQLVQYLDQVILDLEAGSSDQTHLPLAYALRAFCSQDLGNVARARGDFSWAISLDSRNDSLYIARGILLYGIDTQSAIEDFVAAVKLHTQIAYAYLFLAHFYLRIERYEACLAMCNIAVQLQISDKVKANCLEWIAICAAILGSPTDQVRAYFAHALALAPGNDRIRRNSDSFEQSVSTDPIAPKWETSSESDLQSLGRVEFREFRTAA